MIDKAVGPAGGQEKKVVWLDAGGSCSVFQVTGPDGDPADFMKGPVPKFHFEVDGMMAFEDPDLSFREIHAGGPSASQTALDNLLHCRIIQSETAR